MAPLLLRRDGRPDAAVVTALRTSLTGDEINATTGVVVPGIAPGRWWLYYSKEDANLVLGRNNGQYDARFRPLVHISSAAAVAAALGVRRGFLRHDMA